MKPAFKDKIFVCSFIVVSLLIIAGIIYSPYLTLDENKNPVKP